MPKLEGKVTVITGGSSGIGLATAHRFVKETDVRGVLLSSKERDHAEGRCHPGNMPGHESKLPKTIHGQKATGFPDSHMAFLTAWAIIGLS